MSYPLAINLNAAEQALGLYVDGGKTKKPWTGKGALLPNGQLAGTTQDVMTAYFGLYYTPADVIEPHDIITKNVKQFYFPGGDAVTSVKTWKLTADGTTRINMAGRDSTQIQVWPTGAGPVDFHVVPTRWRALFDKDPNAFSPDFLDRARGYACLRFMDTIHTNNSTRSNTRMALSADSYYGELPIEECARLCNTVGADMKLPVPHLSTDDFMVECIKAARGALDPRLQLEVAFSNEDWNPSFAQYKWLLSQCGGDTSKLKAAYGAQLARVSKAIKRSGDGPKTKIALEWQLTSSATLSPIKDGYVAAGGDLALIGSVAPAFYPQPATNDDRDNIIKGAAQNDWTYVLTILNAYIDKRIPHMAAWAKFAKTINPTCAFDFYEWSQAQLVMAPPYIKDDTLRPSIVDYCAAALHSPAGTLLAKRIVEAFQAAGGRYACWWYLLGAPSQYGIYGKSLNAQDTKGFPVSDYHDAINAQGWANRGGNGWFGPVRQ